MKKSQVLVVLAPLATVPVSTTPAVAIESLRCVPGLSYSRIEVEFSKLLEKPECATIQVRSNIDTHLLFVSECRTLTTDFTSRECRTFRFQINNATPDTPLASGARFFVKGAARWCKANAGATSWTAAEPEEIQTTGVIKDGPELSAAACQDRLRVAQRPAAPVPIPSPPVVPPPVFLPQPQPPVVRTSRCEGDFKPVCSDFVGLHYLPSEKATDAQLDEATRIFLADERESGDPSRFSAMELKRLSADALARSGRARGCLPTTNDKITVVACGRAM